MADQDFNIRITETREGTGAADAKQDLDDLKQSTVGVTEATRDSIPAAQAQMEGFRASTHAAHGLHLVMRSFNLLMRGELLMAIQSVTRGLQLLWSAMLANPFTIILAVIGGLIALLVELKGKIDESKKAFGEVKTAEEEAKAKADELTTSIGNINQANLDEAIGKAQKLADEYQRAADEVARRRRYEEQEKDAILGVDLAKIENERLKKLAGVTDPSKRNEINLEYDTKAQQARMKRDQEKVNSELGANREDYDTSEKKLAALKKQKEEQEAVKAGAQLPLSQAIQKLAGAGIASDQDQYLGRLSDLSGRNSLTSDERIELERLKKGESAVKAQNQSGELTYTNSLSTLKEKIKDAEAKVESLSANPGLALAAHRAEAQGTKTPLGDAEREVARLKDLYATTEALPQIKNKTHDATEKADKAIGETDSAIHTTTIQHEESIQKIRILSLRDDELKTLQENAKLNQVAKAAAEKEAEELKKKQEAQKKIVESLEKEEAALKLAGKDTTDVQAKLIQARVPIGASQTERETAELRAQEIRKEAADREAKKREEDAEKKFFQEQPLSAPQRRYGEGNRDMDGSQFVQQDNSRLSGMVQAYNEAKSHASKDGKIDPTENDHLYNMLADIIGLMKRVGVKNDDLSAKYQAQQRELDQMRQWHAFNR